VPGNRTLVLLNFRPEYQAAWMQRSYYHTSCHCFP
jgi:hypothetical protein